MTGDLQGLKVCRRAPSISHFLFADDSLLFFKATVEQALQVKTILAEYCSATGKSVNFDKCSIMFNDKQDDNTVAAIKSVLGIHKEAFEAKYLGLPTPEGRMKKENFQPITDRMAKRCHAWDEKCLSSAGKEILIKVVAQAIPVYVMSVFHLSGSTHEVMAKCIRKLWWGEAQGKRRTHWISWNKFTKSQGDGGLGFRDFKLFNQALLARQAWRLIDRPESLCARVLEAKYFPNGHLMDTAVTLSC